MARKGKVTVGIIGSQFEADIHAASFKIASEVAEVVAVSLVTTRISTIESNNRVVYCGRESVCFSEEEFAKTIMEDRESALFDRPQDMPKPR